MPLQKGKKKKRPRRRGPATHVESDSGATPGSRPTERGRAKRQRWQPPLWMNAVFGAVMIAVGVVFYLVIPQKGSDTKLLFLVLYLALGGLYLGRAYLQYRRKQQTP